VNCWDPRSEPNYNVAREGERECVKMGEYVAISSQAPQECAEGSTTNEHGPNVQGIMGYESTRVRDNRVKKVCNECDIEKSVSEFHRQKECKYGVRNKCKVCAKARASANYHANRDARVAGKREYNAETREHRLQYLREYRAIPEKRALISYLRAKWNEDNNGRYMETQRRNTIAYRECKHKARVAWADRQYMRDLYNNVSEANQIFGRAGVRPEFQVDHIVPIRHKLVSGLHNEFNLQVLGRVENARKHNRFNIG
jgi:hypothetical protein